MNKDAMVWFIGAEKRNLTGYKGIFAGLFGNQQAQARHASSHARA